MTICYLGVGSNLGDRRENIKTAIKGINLLKNTKVIKVSKLIQTKPQGGPLNQNDFFNGALKINTKLSPAVLLKQLKQIERGLGRKKTVRNGPRVIDLDVLLYADKVINTKNLIVPHPRMFERDFVITPLSEII
ncbi:MAG: 2-amino-4-hydroxy-6-hydroxymethyldihydropteridine diphosphokinase [Candidatus Omnitrophota bacterium]